MKKHKPALTQSPTGTRGGKSQAADKDVQAQSADQDVKTTQGAPAPEKPVEAEAEQTKPSADTTGKKGKGVVEDKESATTVAAQPPVDADAARGAPEESAAPTAAQASAESGGTASAAVDDAARTGGEAAQTAASGVASDESPRQEPAVAASGGTSGAEAQDVSKAGGAGDAAFAAEQKAEGEQKPEVEQKPEDEAVTAEGETAQAAGTPSEAVAAAVQPAPRRGGVFALFVSLIALIGVGVVGWQVYELRQASVETREEVAQRLAAGDTTITELRALVRQQNESIASVQGRFGAIEAKVNESEGMAAALEAMYREQTRSRADQVLAEIEQAINIAAQQLQLAGNFEAALIALQGAEARLALPELAHLQPLRRALITDIDALKAHPQVDVSGLALRLEILLERIDGLPLAFEVALERAAAEHEKLLADHENGEVGPFRLSLEYARALALDVWNEVKGMVRLERLDQADPVLLSPEQSTYLRENVKIRLLTARLALLGRDGRTYATDLGQARDWIERFFDTSDERVQRVVADLTELEQTPVKAEPPSLSETFAALRLVQARPAGVRPSSGPNAGSAAGGSR